MTAESPSATARRLQHDRLLDRVGRNTPKGQALLEQWAAEDRAARNGRSRPVATSILTRAAVSRGKVNGHVAEPTPPAEPAIAGERLAQIDLDLIDIAPNVRTQLDDASIDELADSVRSVGVLQPIRVRPVGDRFELVYGQRRLLASRKAGLPTIPAIVDDAGADADPLEQLIENIQREDLNPLEQAKAIRQLLDADPALTQTSVAQQLGRSEPWVSNALRLLELAKPVQQLVAEGKLSGAHAKAIAGLKNPENQKRIADQAVQYDYSVRQVESHVGYQKKTDRSPDEQREDKRKKSERYAKAVIKALEAGNIPKDAQLLDLRLWEVDEKTVHTAIKAAGWTGIGKGNAVGSYGYEPDTIGCDCSAYRYRDYPKPGSFERCCVSSQHVEAWQAKQDGAAKQRQKELADKTKRLTAVLERGLAGIDPTAARMTIAAIAGRGLHDLVKGKGDPWAKVEEIPGDRVAFELGELIASTLIRVTSSDRGWARIDSAGLAAAVNKLAAAPARKGQVSESEPSAATA